MYIYHALINALSAHMIHINLNMILSYNVWAQSHQNSLDRMIINESAKWVLYPREAITEFLPLTGPDESASELLSS